MRKLLIVGAGGHGRSVAEAVLAGGGFSLAGFLDDAYPQLARVWDVPVLGPVSDFAQWRETADCALVAIGNNAVRKTLTEELRMAGFEIPVVIHPRALVSPSAVIGAGAVVMAGAVVGTEAHLGEGAIVNCGAVVDHDCRVGNYGHLGVNAAMAGSSVLGAFAIMQAGSALGYGIKTADGFVLAPGMALGR